jgi:hypothetical protein
MVLPSTQRGLSGPPGPVPAPPSRSGCAAGAAAEHRHCQDRTAISYHSPQRTPGRHADHKISDRTEFRERRHWRMTRLHKFLARTELRDRRHSTWLAVQARRDRARNRGGDGAVQPPAAWSVSRYDYIARRTVRCRELRRAQRRPIAYGLFAFVLGTVVGMVVRRTRVRRRRSLSPSSR